MIEFLIVLAAAIFLYLAFDVSRRFLKKRKRDKKSEDGGFLEWL